MLNGLVCFLFLFRMAGSGGDDPNPAVNRIETGVLDVSLTNSYPRYVHTKSRFYGWDSAVNRDLTEGYDAYDYGPHLIYDQANHVYRMICGGRWRDCSTTNGITHDGDHSLPYAAPPVKASSAASEFRGRLSFASGAVERFAGMTMPGPCYTWGNAVTTAENLAGRARRDTNTWFVANTLEPEFFRFFDRFYMIDQVNVMEGDRLDYWVPGFEFATAKADRLQLHTAPVTNGFNFSRVLVPNPGFTNQWSSHRGIVTNIEVPHSTKLTHQMVMVVPDDPDGKIFWLYAAGFITNDYKGYSLMRSADISTFNWGGREAVSGVSGLGNQAGYINLDDGRRLYVMIGEAPLVDGHRGTLLKFSADGRAFKFCNSVRIDEGHHAASTTGSVSLAMSALTNNPDNQNHYFNGLCTIDGWGELEPLGNNTFRAYYASTTANAPVSPGIFKAEIGLGEVIFQLSDNITGFDWSGTDTDVDDDGIPNLADRDADNDGAENDWEKFTGRDPYDLTDCGVFFDQDGNPEGWTATGLFSGVSVTSGCFTGTTAGPAAALISPALGFPGNRLVDVHIRLKTAVNAYLQFQWQTASDPVFTSDRSVLIAAGAKDAFVWVKIGLGDNGLWMNDQIARVQIKPCLATGATVAVDKIIFSDGDRDHDGIGDATEGYGDSDGDGIENFLDPDP